MNYGIDELTGVKIIIPEGTIIAIGNVFKCGGVIQREYIITKIDHSEIYIMAHEEYKRRTKMVKLPDGRLMTMKEYEEMQNSNFEKVELETELKNVLDKVFSETDYLKQDMMIYSITKAVEDFKKKRGNK